MSNEKLILDATCGSRMMWFDRKNKDVLYCDNRTVNTILCDGRQLDVEPDMTVDFRCMPFPDGSFHLVVFDPPHLEKLGQDTWMAQKYGRLLPSWKDDIHQGFTECMRVLKPHGTLIFKWNEIQVKLSDVLDAIGTQPLFGHTSGKHGRTIWLAFMKTTATN